MKDANNWLVIEQVSLFVSRGPYLLPPLQLTEDSLEALVHVVKLNIGHARQIQREKQTLRFQKTNKIDVDKVYIFSL